MDKTEECRYLESEKEKSDTTEWKARIIDGYDWIIDRYDWISVIGTSELKARISIVSTFWVSHKDSFVLNMYWLLKTGFGNLVIV